MSESGQNATMTEPTTAPVTERMQSLLSRAVEDQLSEQRHLTLVLSELRTLLARIDEQLRDPGATQQLTRLTQLVAGLGASISADAEERAGEAEALRAAFASFTDFPAAVSAGLVGVQEDLAAVQTRLAGLPALQQPIDALQLQLEDVAARVADSTGRDELRQALLGRLGELEARLGEHAAGLDAAAAERDEELRDRVDDLAERVGMLEEGMTALSAPDGLLAGVAGRLEVIELGEQVATVQADVAAGREQVAGLVSALDRAPLAAAVSETLAGELAGVRREVDRLAAVVPPEADDLAQRVAVEVSSGLAAAVEQAVSRQVVGAMAATERRLSAHVDEAVLALAEALLRRRRPPRPAAAVPEAAASAHAEPVDLQPAGREEAADEPSVAQPAKTRAGGAPPAATDSQRAEPAGAESAHVEPARSELAPAKEPVVEEPPRIHPVAVEPDGAEPGAGSAANDATDPEARRRPWWRSGA